jgi:hypothetical protein
MAFWTIRKKNVQKKSSCNVAAGAFRLLDQPRLVVASVIPQPVCGMETMRKNTGPRGAPSMIFL